MSKCLTATCKCGSMIGVELDFDGSGYNSYMEWINEGYSLSQMDLEEATSKLKACTCNKSNTHSEDKQ